MHSLAIKAREGTEYRGQKKKGGGERHREQGRTEEKRKREGEREKNTENRGNRWGIIKKKNRGKERTSVKKKRDALDFFFGGSSKGFIFSSHCCYCLRKPEEKAKKRTNRLGG
jgi:hypothetical protein